MRAWRGWPRRWPSSLPEAEVLRFPAWDCLPYDRVSPNPALVSERIATLARLLEKPPRPRIVLTTVNALVQRVPPRSAFTDASLELRTNGTVQPEKLARFLEANGYGRAGTVMEPGEYAMRGGIIDIFPAGEADPVRLDLFGDTIESIRVFDPGTQRSAEQRQRLILRPVSEVPLDPDAISRFRSGWRETFGQPAADDPIYLSISDGRRHPGMEHWVPLFHERMETLLDYLPGASVSLDHQADEVLAARLEMIEDHYAARRLVPRDGEVPYRPLPPDRLYLDQAGWDAMLAGGPLFAFSPFAKPDGAVGVDGGGRPGPVFFQAAAARAPTCSISCAARSNAGTARAGGSSSPPGPAARASGSPTCCASTASRTPRSRTTGPRSAASRSGRCRWSRSGSSAASSPTSSPWWASRTCWASASAVRRAVASAPTSSSPRRRKSPRATWWCTRNTASAATMGWRRCSVTGAPHDCLRLIYDGDEKLFLPVENIEVLSRFGSEGQGVALDKLGGVAWQSRKARMKQRIRDMAGQLIRIAAARKIRDAAIMAPGEGAWDEFCARFPFAETEDQSRAIADVLEDLAVGRPMDRLICGDVGFGKTEVALRAAFVAAMSGAQVAVVVPTTLLARQHYRTFSERFAGLPVKVAQLSRMVTAKEAAEVRRGITDGSINIVIGTHALLAKSVEFADLGLLVVDEEQHFGVAHKERLKQLKADVHVLTLTATPIPRTLQLALTGVREMSLIATPPVDRLAVRTFIMPFDGVVIREALQRERFRGGQVFCVVPRIEDLPRMAERLAEIVPEARMAQAHGRLAPTELERVMTEFGDGHYDILLSTNIVESGLDMPAVNTLVIHRADMFGLGQLYQLRGRVGRGKQRGYAYLTWPPNLRLSVAAEKRLTVMQTLDALGAGFTLASHDLDIRGAGNLLGDEQSGPYPRSRHRAVSADAGGRGRRTARRRGPPRRAGTRLDAEHLARPAGADPGGLRARPAGPARPVPADRRAGLGRRDRGDGGGAGRSLRPAAAGGGEPAAGGGAEARLPRGRAWRSWRPGPKAWC